MLFSYFVSVVCCVGYNWLVGILCNLKIYLWLFIFLDSNLLFICIFSGNHCSFARNDAVVLWLSSSSTTSSGGHSVFVRRFLLLLLLACHLLSACATRAAWRENFLRCWKMYVLNDGRDLDAFWHFSYVQCLLRCTHVCVWKLFQERKVQF